MTENPISGCRLRRTCASSKSSSATARGGSTRAAADRVARSQSAASAALAELEAALGAPLFDRVGRRLVLNENGRALLPRAASMLDEAAELQQLFSSDHAAPLRVAASFTIGEYLLPEIVRAVEGRHPGRPACACAIGNTARRDRGGRRLRCRHRLHRRARRPTPTCGAAVAAATSW